MTQAARSRSGLDIPEGSANADTVSETKLIDTNAEDARNEVSTEQDTSSSPGVDAPPPDATGSPGTTTDPGTEGTPHEGTTPGSQPSTDQPVSTPSEPASEPSDTPSNTPDTGTSEVAPDGSTETAAEPTS